MADWRVVVVLGMHHSGTSVIARALPVLDVFLGDSDSLMPAQLDHPTGLWEDQSITETNDQILLAQGFSWRTPGFDCTRMKRDRTYRQTVKAIRLEVQRRFGHSPLWGFLEQAER